ncbi:MAG TPA: MFS transporter [Rectinemataceae bacterium]|nr:MFS transporter [Rectinemataceae bacterium]
MPDSLTPAARSRARKDFDVFNFLNSSSFGILSGSLVTLLALKLGASAFFVGILNALAYVSFFFMPLGKRLIARRPIVSIYHFGWLWRYIAMIPVAAAPLLVLTGGSRGFVFILLFSGVAGFNIFRGIGMIGSNPVTASLAEGGDRGGFVSRVQILANLAALGTNLAVSIIMGRSASGIVYAALMGSGIAIGIAGTHWLKRIPEPVAYRPQPGGGIWATTREAWKERPFRNFMGIYVLICFTAGMGKTFLPVYAKTIYRQGDDVVMILTLVSSLGGMVAGMLSRLVLDRLGAKPLYAIYGFIAILGFVPALLTPSLEGFLGAFALLGGLFFVSSFGLTGQDGAGQTYYFALVPRERTLDLAVAYFIANGIGGTLGSILGGLILDGFAALGLGDTTSWRLFYGLVDILLFVAILVSGGMVRLGSSSVRESLESLLSLRDLRTFDILTRLDRSEDPGEELELIHELGVSGSTRSQKDLVGYLSSPRFEQRVEALHSLEILPELDADSLVALRGEVEGRPDTTGYIAARILGKRGDTEAIPILRAALAESDHLIRGAAAIALARLGDARSRIAIEDFLRSSLPARLRLQAVFALELIGSPASLPILVASLSRDDPPAFVSDELVLAMASILGIMEDFWPLYQVFSEDEERGLSLLRLSAAERLGAAAPTLAAPGGGAARPWPRRSAEAGKAARAAIDRFDAALASLFAEPGDGVPLARLLLESAEDTGAVIVFADALFDQRLAYRGFRYLAAALMVFGRRVADAGGAGVANPGVTDAGGVGAGDAGGAGARLGGEGEAEGPGSAS